MMETSHVARRKLMKYLKSFILEKWENENTLPVIAKDFPPFVKKWNFPSYLFQIQLLGALFLVWDLHSHLENVSNWKKEVVKVGERGLAVEKCRGRHRWPGEECHPYFWPARRSHHTVAALGALWSPAVRSWLNFYQRWNTLCIFVHCTDAMNI